MPLYEYHCCPCNRDFEELVMGDDSDVRCPKCGGKKVKKLMSACAHKTSGGGFVPSSGGSGCSSCSGGNCSSCH